MSSLKTKKRLPLWQPKQANDIMISVTKTNNNLFKKPLSIWGLIEALIDPAFAFGIFYLLAIFYTGSFDTASFLFSLIVFLVNFPGHALMRKTKAAICKNICLDWLLFAAILIMLMKGTSLLEGFQPKMLYLWLVITPIALTLAHLTVQQCYKLYYRDIERRKKVIIIGKNEITYSLADAIINNPMTSKQLMAFFDARLDSSRVPEPPAFINEQKIRSYSDSILSEYVNRNKIDIIYIGLPMVAQPRITQLLTGLEDTTASIYFVPDIFVTDLIQARIDRVSNLPVVAVRETPFYGANSLVKRLFDIVFSLAVLILLSPIMLTIALAVKTTSKGPVIFKQKRYGLDGEEILVYKFRSMTVMENDQTVRQATKNDQRLTKIGGFLRRTSLDELPQFLNVLMGSMSIVGPRPHAVSHNEQYRKQISGYMIRHKVKPGITGLAQIKGFRGETETLDKMQSRVACDLEYLRSWSLGLDINIILKTIMITIQGKNAY